jgi:hypothetical protein
MHKNLTCSQVIALLSFYIQGKTNYQVTNFIQAHLCSCELCRKKYETLQVALNGLKDAKKQIDAVELSPNDNLKNFCSSFKEKMSAYLDSELSDEENLRFKRYAIANPPVRGELEGLCKVKNALNNSFEKTKSDFREDFSKDIIVKLDMKDTVYMQEPILKIASIFIFLFVFLSVGLIVIF